MKNGRIIFLATLLLTAFFSSCSKGQYDDEKEFRIKLIGKEEQVVIAKYVGTKRSVTIPSQIQEKPVTQIGHGAFSKNQLTGVIIPSSVTHIGGFAFCKNQLTGITIPDGITQIEGYTFATNQLKSVVILDSVTSIGKRAFFENDISKIAIGANVDLDAKSFDNDFSDFYNENGRRAGTYTFNDGAWDAEYR